MCSNGWSIVAPATLGSRRRRFARATSSSPRRCPTTPLTDRNYDVGDFEGAMRACLAKADCAGFDARAEESRSARHDPRLRPLELYRMHRLGRRRDGLASPLEKNGDFTVAHRHPVERAGTRDRLCAGGLAIISTCPLSASRSCRATPTASRPATAPAARARSRSARSWSTRASQTLAASLKDLAADKLEAAVADLEIADGRVRIAGTDRSISYAEIAALPASDGGETDRDRNLHPAERDLSQRNACLRSRDRPRNWRTTIVALRHRRRLRLHAESAAAGGPGAWRHRAGRRTGADGARGLRRGTASS